MTERIKCPLCDSWTTRECVDYVIGLYVIGCLCQAEGQFTIVTPDHRAVRGADGFPLLVPSPSRTADADAAIGQPGSTAPRDAEVAPLGGDIRGDTLEEDQ